MAKNNRVLLSSAARTADATSQAQKDPLMISLRLYLNVTAVSGTGGLIPIIRGYDMVSGAYAEISGSAPAITQTGAYVYELHLSGGGPSAPGVATGNVIETIDRPLPYKWDVIVKHLDASSYTYSLGAELQGPAQ